MISGTLRTSHGLYVKKKLKCKVPLQCGVRKWWKDLYVTSPGAPSFRKTSPLACRFKLGLLEMLSHSLGTRWDSRGSASEGTKFHLGFAPQACSPCFVATPATLCKFILLLWEPCVKSTSHLFLPPSWMPSLGPISHQLTITTAS